MPLFWHDRWRRGDAFGAGSDRMRNGFGKSELSPLGIPAVRDRVVQTAALPILEPVFEADFLDCSYGFRPGRSAHQALEEIRGHVQAGYRAVSDEDLRGYFDSIPHTELLACVDVRAVDRPVPVMERSGGQGGGSTWSRAGKGNSRW